MSLCCLTLYLPMIFFTHPVFLIHTYLLCLIGFAQSPVQHALLIYFGVFIEFSDHFNQHGLQVEEWVSGIWKGQLCSVTVPEGLLLV